MWIGHWAILATIATLPFEARNQSRPPLTLLTSWINRARPCPGGSSSESTHRGHRVDRAQNRHHRFGEIRRRHKAPQGGRPANHSSGIRADCATFAGAGTRHSLAHSLRPLCCRHDSRSRHWAWRCAGPFRGDSPAGFEQLARPSRFRLSPGHAVEQRMARLLRGR